VLKAYSKFGIPCVVEHGALHIDSLNGLPGGISKVVWDKIGDKICDILPETQKRSATAKSVVGYCDGRQIHLFSGETRGEIAEASRGDRKFQWDPIFIPEGLSQTYAELTLDEKKVYSQGTKAWKKLIDFLTKIQVPYV
jgi:XTP/dITP diphosphohydrolase